MKKWLLSILVLLLSSTAFSFTSPIKEVVFFGDSLSDNGNLYNLIKIIPRSPPYYDGRFSNGPVWSELAGQHLLDNYAIPYSVYAIGGAYTYLHADPGLFDYTLDDELTNYKTQSYLSDKSHVLYVIWIGANDYLYESPKDSDVDVLSTQVIGKINDAIEDLKGRGARYFLILSLPDLGKTPYAKLNHLEERLHLMSSSHNQKLTQTVMAFNANNPEFKAFYLDADWLLNDLIQNPDKYNQKYHTNINNFDQACWTGGLMSHYQDKRLMHSPALQETDRVGHLHDYKLEPCTNPNEHVFWDQVHPTAAIHKILSAVALEMLEKELNS